MKIFEKNYKLPRKMQKITINYAEYRLPEKPDWLDSYMLLISEYFEAPGYKQDKNFILFIEHPEIFLIKNKTFTVDCSLVRRKEPVEFKILNWKYNAGGRKDINIEVSVKEIKPPLVEVLFTKLPDMWQNLLPMLLLLLPFSFFIISYALIMDYPEPLEFWQFVGVYIRGFIGISLFIMMLIALIWSQIRFRKSAMLGTFTGVILSFFTLALPLLWLMISVRPKEIVGEPLEDILYLNYLRNHFTSFFLVFVGIIPWLTIFLKYFGLDLIVAILNKIAKDNEK